MAATDNFRKQHADILDIAGKLQNLLEPQKLVTAATEARASLSVLLGKLSVHLAMEDNSLYPRCRTHTDAKLRETADNFATEMSSMRPTVEAFGKKWSEPAIRADSAAFCAEAKRLFATLQDRIARENSIFYPLVDKAA